MKKEIWKDIAGYEGLYQVSSFGKIKALPKYTNSNGYLELRKEKLLKPALTGKFRNYPTVTFVKDGKRKSYKVHRLVAEAFIPNPDKYPMINHRDENTLNNMADNLEWCTNRYNVKYSAKPLTEEHKNKLRNARIGKKLSKSTKEKMKYATEKRFQNAEERDKHSKRMKDWWSNRKCQI